MQKKQRGRPKLDIAERERRIMICREWANEIKTITGFSANRLADEFNFSNERKDGRAWRALASGTNTPSPIRFRQMTAKAARNRWLKSFGYVRYANYWNPFGEDQSSDLGLDQVDDLELGWRQRVFGSTVLMMLAHASQCGIKNQNFFRDASETLRNMEKYLADETEDEIVSRARRISRHTVQELLDGPQYPETSMVLERRENFFSNPELYPIAPG